MGPPDFTEIHKKSISPPSGILTRSEIRKSQSAFAPRLYNRNLTLIKKIKVKSMIMDTVTDRVNCKMHQVHSNMRRISDWNKTQSFALVEFIYRHLHYFIKIQLNVLSLPFTLLYASTANVPNSSVVKWLETIAILSHGSQPTSLKYILILSSHLHLGLPRFLSFKLSH